MKNYVVLLLPEPYIRHKSTLVNTRHFYLVDSKVCQQYTQDTLLHFHCNNG